MVDKMLSKNLILIILFNLMITKSLSFKRDVEIKNGKKICLPIKSFLLLTSLKSDLKINGFRAESSKHPITIDENGLTVIPDQKVINLRIFGNNLMSGNNEIIKIGFTTTDGRSGDKCDPDRDFTVKQVINSNMALVEIKLSETITDKPYYVCYGFSKYDLNRYITDSKEQLFLAKSFQYYYLSSVESMKIRVIGRSLANNDKNHIKESNIKMKLAQIVDEANKIHRIADEMQEW